ncbi:MAG: phenylalanine--tRNA ligase subunit beta [Patescibacteria group bacterium]
MNIKITHSWLLDYLDTDATPYEIHKYLSLCGPSVETVEAVTDDYVYDIEITSNRIDMASVFGIAQEATAILPQFGKRAQLRTNPLDRYLFSEMNAEPSTQKKLKINVLEPDVCHRFTATVVDGVTIKQSPELIRRRLELCDINPINNIVDISNYIMLALGQPTHAYDFDRIGKHQMTMRTSKQGEHLITLDGKKFVLPGGDIVIEDGDGRLIDMCGIMGGENSAITPETTTVVWYVQNYDKRRIRRTSMSTGQRSVAATYFEKGLDSERVEQAFTYGIDLIYEHAGGSIASKIYDIYPRPYQTKSTQITFKTINDKIGVAINPDTVVHILSNLGFSITRSGDVLDINIPSYRADDVDIPEDIIEEVARVYGYHNIPTTMKPIIPIQQQKELHDVYQNISRIKTYLSHIGLTEVMNYSMTSQAILEQIGIPLSAHYALANTISEDITYMRTHLFPSLVQNIANNQGKRPIFRFFELTRIYSARKDHSELPDERYHLSIATSTDFFDLKAIIEALFSELKIPEPAYIASNYDYFLPGVQADICIPATNGSRHTFGMIGQIKPAIQDTFGLSKPVFVCEFELETLVRSARSVTTYTPPNQYAEVHINRTISQTDIRSFADLKVQASTISSMLSDVQLVQIEAGTMVVRFSFSASDRNITEPEAKTELTKIEEGLSLGGS